MKPETPLQRRVYNFIRERIDSRELLPGQQLPTEQELSEYLQVSRITAHRALQRLAKEGLIQRFPGKGSFVAEAAATEVARPTPHMAGAAPEHPGASRLLGFICPAVSDDFGLDVLASAIARAEEHGWSMIVSFTHQSQAAEEAAIQRAVRAGVKGLLVNPVYGEYYSDQLLSLHLRQFPLVLVDKRLDKIPIPYVSTDNRAAAYDLTRHLIDLGHRKIGFISPGVTATATLEDRFAGYLAALEDHRIPYDHTLNLSSLPTGGGVNCPQEQDVYQTIRHYLLEHRELTAVLITEYVFAGIICELCRELQKQIPEDLSVVCFDSPRSAPFMKFTHIDQQQAEIGRTAVDMLLDLIEGKQPTDSSVQLPGQLVVGHSSGRAPAGFAT
ncbi:GntR family transcriptional regulator [Alicyclobacillus kakegawensis]|uniref:GntR family transcriptional regulator n=1 Tax=Alicyclobacillus kakegawensis TaxID=392012 RepID=UPI000829D495|nr:GntR family transcriptional regulator [Alicyclobacillus kakegawensis]